MATCCLNPEAALEPTWQIYNLQTLLCREVVERRAHIVTGRKPTEAEVDNMIDTGESETIFQKAILEQGRGHVSSSTALSPWCLLSHFHCCHPDAHVLHVLCGSVGVG